MLSSGPNVWKDILGLVLVVLAFVGLGVGIYEVTAREYVGALLALGAGVATLRGGVDVLRPTVGE